MPSFRVRRSGGYKPAFFWFCLFALAWAVVLLFAGGFTTSIRAGMAFLDWPLSNGSVNPEGWLSERDKLAEHSHRLLGMKVGLLAIALASWTWLREERAWVRTLARVLLLIVILQGVMGGARVRFDQMNTLAESNWVAQAFAVAHACGAQAVVVLLVSLTLASSRGWTEGAYAGAFPDGLRRFGLVASAAVFVQILLGAVMRHADAGLAIAKFPLARTGSFIPAYWDFGVGIHFAHRAGALVVFVLLCVYAGKLLAHPGARRFCGTACAALLALLVGQIYLGALTIWTVKNPHVATLHMLTGAFLLATVWGLTFVSYRSGIRAATGVHNRS